MGTAVDQLVDVGEVELAVREEIVVVEEGDGAVEAGLRAEVEGLADGRKRIGIPAGGPTLGPEAAAGGHADPPTAVDVQAREIRLGVPRHIRRFHASVRCTESGADCSRRSQ